jgi:Nuclease-related domain
MMGKDRTGTSDAGASARAEWRRALSSARRRRSISLGFVVAAVGLVVLGWWQADGRWVAVAAIAAVAAWWARPEPDPDRWRRGADGEAATAALLSRLPPRWLVLNDLAVPGSRANIDHLVIGPTGVWVVDTKTTRARLRLRRGAVWAGDHAIETGSVAWEAEVVSGRLAVDAAPLIAVHGVGLRRRGKRSGGVRVVPAGGLIRRLRRGRRVLSRREVAALARRATDVFPPR